MSNWFVVVMGIGTVFFGLICIVVLSYLMSAICRKTEKSTESAASVAPVATESIPNRQAMIAAISAAIAEDSGTDLSAIRILSVKKI